MFKGLKSKLEDEAKRLQASVSQYGENIAQQMRTGTSDAGSDIGGQKHLYPWMTMMKTSHQHPNKELPLCMALMIPTFGTRGETRRLSGASVESNESTFSTFTMPSSSVAMQLDTINSDVESNAVNTRAQTFILQGIKVIFSRGVITDASSLETAPKEQVGSLFQKLQGRATDYKQRYRDLAKSYQELSEKMINIGTEKLNKTKADENLANLETKNKALHDLLKKLIKKRQTQASCCEEKAAIAIATSKAEMHSNLNNKDQEIEKWMNKCHSMEKKDSDANQRLQKQNDELNKLVVAMENEKADMVEKLARAKQEGVKQVKEDEEKKRKQLTVQHSEKLALRCRKRTKS
uniref:Uncharacterized protein n=1 Tax=Ditylenchus dipsaci TaxID=166011 RepID=A0A915EBB3_9BILA